MPDLLRLRADENRSSGDPTGAVPNSEAFVSISGMLHPRLLKLFSDGLQPMRPSNVIGQWNPGTAREHIDGSSYNCDNFIRSDSRDGALPKMRHGDGFSCYYTPPNRC
jgi:hypothetical protein